MAIGSNPEIGASFKSCREYTSEDWEKWWAYMRANWGEYLQAGHSVLIHDKNNNPYYDEDARKAYRNRQ